MKFPEAAVVLNVRSQAILLDRSAVVLGTDFRFEADCLNTVWFLEKNRAGEAIIQNIAA